jgi:molybdopterin converting factor small subunit
MTVTVRLFAFYADKLGTSEILLDLGDGSTVADAVARTAAMPGGSALPVSPIVAVYRKYSCAETGLTAVDEIAIIPPVAGG